jgi:hypothetical protein
MKKIFFSASFSVLSFTQLITSANAREEVEVSFRRAYENQNQFCILSSLTDWSDWTAGDLTMCADKNPSSNKVYTYFSGTKGYRATLSPYSFSYEDQDLELANKIRKLAVYQIYGVY